MRPILCRWFAISSVLLCLTAHAATRPRYGGNLRVETRAAVASLDPAQLVPSADASTRDSIVSLIADTLVTLDESARPVPRLATRWQSDNGNKRWQFWVRAGVFLHNGASLTPAHVAQSLAASNPTWKVRANSESIIIESELPLPYLPAELSRPVYAIISRADQMAGTGPFRLEDFQPGRRLVLRANDEYWLGRPYVDSITFNFSVPLRDQAVRQQLGQVDVIELAPDQVRRTVQDNRRTASSLASELIAIVVPNGTSPAEDPRLRQAISLATDRAAINAALLQRQGEPTAAMLPAWISGYAFLFPATRDVDHARQLRSEVATAQAPLTLAYDPADTLLRSIAERIAVNARDAGISLQPIPANGQPVAAKLVRIAAESSNAHAAFAAMTSAIDPAETARVLTANNLSELYSAERALLDDFRIIPLAHVPQSFALAPRIRNWAEPREGGMPLATVWIEPPKESAKP